MRRNILRIAVRIVLAGLAAACIAAAAAQAQQAAAPEDPVALLARVGLAYRTIKSFHFEATEETVTRSNDFVRKTAGRYLTVRDRSGRRRVEFKDNSAESWLIFDGETHWAYLPIRNVFTRASAASAPDAGDLLGRVLRRYPERYGSLGERIERARTLRFEEVQLASRRVSCIVVEAHYNAPPGVAKGKIRRTFWIDPAGPLILREVAVASTHPAALSHPVEVTQTVKFSVAAPDPDVSEEMFTFVAPDGAREVASLAAARQPSAGPPDRTAPDFALSDLQGATFRLSEFRGKVVLLNFWASWCGPCRVEMPRIEALGREFQDRGLVVVGVNDEPRSTARAYLEAHELGLRSLVDLDSRVAKQYQVDALPTVIVVDREGKVASYLRGSRPKSVLRREIEKAGL